MHGGVARPAVRAQDKPRVLVVDDDADTLTLLEMFLELSGFEVTTASDGVEALGVAAGGFDVITTDLAMPRMDGGELIQRIHDLPITPIPVILVTAQNIDESVAQRLHPCGIITKPCQLDELVCTLRSLLTRCTHDRFSCSHCPLAAR